MTHYKVYCTLKRIGVKSTWAWRVANALTGY